MTNPEALKLQIQAAFADVKFPGNWCLRGSNEGEEPLLLERAFEDKSDWRSLDPQFIDRAPDGYGTALSFFSDEAFRFYLPAHLIADINNQLEQQSPLLHLTNGLSNDSKHERVNPRRYGDRTWFEASAYHLAVFNHSQAAAIVAYLRYKVEVDESHNEPVNQALKNYWLARVDVR